MTTVQTKTIDPALLTAMNGQKSSKSSVDEAQDRFMTLLVTQMKNQDPLNPMDNAQVTSQLAQLSTVTGIDKLNATVTSLSASIQAGQNLQAASMIGHGVITEGKGMTLAKGQGVYGMDLSQAADKVDVTIRNAAGVAVRKISLGAQVSGENSFTWDGKDDSGKALADGSYSFDIAASMGGQKVTATPLAFGVVNGVSNGTDGVKLSVANVGDVALSSVRKIF